MGKNTCSSCRMPPLSYSSLSSSCVFFSVGHGLANLMRMQSCAAALRTHLSTQLLPLGRSAHKAGVFCLHSPLPFAPASPSLPLASSTHGPSSSRFCSQAQPFPGAESPQLKLAQSFVSSALELVTQQAAWWTGLWVEGPVGFGSCLTLNQGTKQREA